MKIFLNALILSLLLIFSACSDSNTEKVITSFSNDLNDTTIISNRTLQVNVFAHYDDGSEEEITDSLIWSSLDEDMASVEDGLISAKNVVGDVQINYKTQETLSSGLAVEETTFTLTVKDTALEKITLSKSVLSLWVGTSQNVQAIGAFEDGSTHDVTNDCVWSSLDSNVSSVNKGLVSGVSEGNTTIVAVDGNVTSDTLSVEVSQSHYSSVELTSPSSNFNVGQTIELIAIATTSEGESVELKADEVTWLSDNENVVSVDEATGVATAISKESATVTATLKADETLQDSLILTVDKDVYMRLFKDGEEISFPSANVNEYEVFPDEFSSFSMIAVGKDFSISGLSVKNFSGSLTINGWFENLSYDDVILEDENRTFELMHNGLEKELHFYFRIDDEFDNEFSEKYKEDD